MLKLLLSSIIFLSCSLFTLTIQAQNSGKAETVSKPVEKKYADNGFFKYEITGNADEDGLNYTAAKLKFKETNPAGYEQWVKQNTGTTIRNISRKELEALPKDKQEHILSSPSLYNVVD